MTTGAEPASLTAPDPLPAPILGGSAYELDPESPRSFARDGFFGPIEVYQPAEAADIAARVDRLRAQARELEPKLYEVEAASLADPERFVFHCLGGWLVDDGLRAAVFDARITVPAAQCLGVRRLRFWHDQVFTKPPHHPGVVPWHQDYAYWQRTAPECHVTVHIALDDADTDNGCLHYIAGSHRWPLLERVDFDGPMEALFEARSATKRSDATTSGAREDVALHDPQPMRLRAGQAVIHHSRVAHGSFENLSPRPRRALVLNYFADGVRSAIDGPMLRGLPASRVGDLLVEPWFPLVLDRL
ncbi:MAG TPA: phytanoyl-CoA dioxygenase family protein [Planctomycetota bacterium]|nr:phytanoyl-CoA dioxygenase family protein [Planctomycetota bacterium]